MVRVISRVVHLGSSRTEDGEWQMANGLDVVGEGINCLVIDMECFQKENGKKRWSPYQSAMSQMKYRLVEVEGRMSEG